MDNPPDHRIGDRERRAVDDRLQRATGDGLLTLSEYDERSGQLWQARTRSELDAVTADLPPEHVDQPAAAFGQPARRLWAVLSEDRMSGGVLPRQRLQATAILGSAEVDLRRDDLPAHVDLHVVGVLGEVVVLVRPEVTVRLSGASILGTRAVKLPGHAPGTPVVDIFAVAVLGSVVVQSAPDAATGQLARRDRANVPVRRRRLLRAVGAVALAVGITAGGVAVVGHGSDGRAVFGSTVVQKSGQDVDVGVLFGSVTVVVPDGARVDTSGTVVFGSLDCNQACEPGESGPVVHVRGSGGFGSVEIKTRSEYTGD
ncbi:MAG: DUF1707 domain-containing protein [Pseudonocardiales bacterium]